MANNQIKTRIIHKHDTEANWNLATNFIPKQGEIIIYDKDSTYSYERFKIGDGTTNVINLPFASNVEQPDWNAADGEDGHILNRTHWVEEGIVYVMPVQGYVINEGTGGVAQITSPLPDSIVAGAELVVNYNGTDYPAVVSAVTLEGYDTLAFGCYGALTGGEMTADPYAFVVMPAELAAVEGVYAMILPVDGSTVFTFGVKAEGEVVHTLDEKYIPDSVKVPTITITKQNDNYTVDCSFEDAWAMSENMLQSAIVYIDKDSSWIVRMSAASVSKLGAPSESVAYDTIQITLEPSDDTIDHAIRKLCLAWVRFPGGGPTLIGVQQNLVLLNADNISGFIAGPGLTTNVYNELEVNVGAGLQIPTDGKNYKKLTLKTMTATEVGGAKVGEGLEVVDGALKISNNEATEDEIMELLASLDMFPVITDADGSILTDENDAILLV